MAASQETRNLHVRGDMTVDNDASVGSLSFDGGDNSIDQIVNGMTWPSTVVNGLLVTGTGVVDAQTYEKVGRQLIGHFRITGLTTAGAGALHSFTVDLPEPAVMVPSCTASAILQEIPSFNQVSSCGFTDFSPPNTLLFLWRTVAATQALTVYINMHYQTAT